MTRNEDARASLAAMAEARSRLARTAKLPFWRHLLSATILGGFVAAYALPRSYQAVSIAFLLGATLVLMRQDSERRGLFINPYRRGRGGWIAAGLVAFVLLAFGGGVVARYVYGADWAPLAIGMIVVVISLAVGLWWERVYLARIEAEESGR